MNNFLKTNEINVKISNYVHIEKNHNFYGSLNELWKKTAKLKKQDKKFVSKSNVRDFYPNISDDDIFNKDFDMYKKIKIGQSKTKKNIECLKFEIMIDPAFFSKNLNQQQKIIDKLVKSCINTEMNLIYFTTVREVNNKYKSVYMDLVAIDKEIYPNGHEVPKIALNTVYKDNKTHEIISHNNIDKLNKDTYYLAQRKGDLLGNKIIYCSTKYREYSTATKERLIQKTHALKTRIERVILNHFKTRKYENFVKLVQTRKLSYYNIHDVIHSYDMRKLKAINHLIDTINVKMNSILIKLMNNQNYEYENARNEVLRRYGEDIDYLDKNKNKFKHMKIYNIKDFEDMIYSKIEQLNETELMKFGRKVFKEKFVIIYK